MIMTPTMALIMWFVMLLFIVSDAIIFTRFVIERNRCTVMVAKGDYIIRVITNMPSEERCEIDFEGGLVRKIVRLLENREE